MRDPSLWSVVTGSCRSLAQICQMQKKKRVAAVEGHRSSQRYLNGSVERTAGQSIIFRVPTERMYPALCNESKTLILSIDSFIYLVIEAPQGF
jgi:hypothetical protein